MRIITFSIALLVSAVALPAQACLPPPPPPPPPAAPNLECLAGESAENCAARTAQLTEEYEQKLAEYKAREAQEKADARARHISRERQYWDSADTVIIARVLGDREASRNSMRIKSRVRLQPEKTLKGSGKGRPFKLKYEILIWCGISSEYGMHLAKAGDRFIFFSHNPNMKKKHIITGYKVESLTNPDIIARMDGTAED